MIQNPRRTGSPPQKELRRSPASVLQQLDHRASSEPQQTTEEAAVFILQSHAAMLLPAGTPGDAQQTSDGPEAAFTVLLSSQPSHFISVFTEEAAAQRSRPLQTRPLQTPSTRVETQVHRLNTGSEIERGSEQRTEAHGGQRAEQPAAVPSGAEQKQEPAGLKVIRRFSSEL